MQNPFQNFENLENKFIEISKYVHISEKNYNLYSHEIIDLMIRVGVEIENILRLLFVSIYETDPEKEFKTQAMEWLNKNLDSIDLEKLKKEDSELYNSIISNYKLNWIIEKIEEKVSLFEKVIYFKMGYINISDESRFINTFEKSTNGSYIWQRCYNKCKHDRTSIYDEKFEDLLPLKSLIYGLATLYHLTLIYLFKSSEKEYEGGATSSGLSLPKTYTHNNTGAGSRLKYALEDFENILFNTVPSKLFTYLISNNNETDKYIYGLYSEYVSCAINLHGEYPFLNKKSSVFKFTKYENTTNTGTSYNFDLN